MENRNNLVENLKNIYGENLISAVLYGENNNLIAVFNKLEATDLKKALPSIKILRKTKTPLPVVMSEEEWLSSADIYPIEYTEIKNNYKILHGKDVVESITVSKQHLRLQCEYEIKNLLVKIREIYLGNSDNPKFVLKTLEEVSLRFIRILKSALSLFDIKSDGNYSEIIQKMSKKADFDGEIFVKILSEKEKNKEIETSVQRTINGIDKLYKFINDLELV